MSKSKKIKPMTMKDELAEFSDEMDQAFDRDDPAITIPYHTIAESFKLKGEEETKKISCKLKIVGWIATILSLLGIFLNAYQIIWCWLIWTVSNFFWIYWSVKKKEWHQTILWSVFTLANLYAWYVWATILK